MTNLPAKSPDNADGKGSAVSLLIHDCESLLTQARVMVVDDNSFSRQLVCHILSTHGVIHIEEAVNGEDALQRLHSNPPDLVILDLMMPIMDGNQFCHAVRALPEHHHLPILVLTAVDEPHQRSAALLCGASDLISKPVIATELMARCIIHLERRWLVQELVHYKASSEADLSQARIMQYSLLPSDEQIRDIALHYRIAIASYFEPSHHIGGDFWGCHRLNESELALYIADFSGHGVTAALNSFRFDAVLAHHDDAAHDTARYMTRLNSQLRDMLQPGQFATMFYGIIDIVARTLRYSTAGTTTAVIIRGQSGTIDTLDGTGFPLAATDDATYSMKSVKLDVGDILVLYSDALIETPAPDGTMWEEAQLLDFLRMLAHVPDRSLLNAENVLHAIRLEFDSVRQSGGHIPDDLTLTAWQCVA